jgi:hypothetical protein
VKLRLPAKRLHLPALMLFGALVIGGGLIILGLSIHADSKTRLARVSKLATDAAHAALEAPMKLRQIQESNNVYAQLHQVGFLGPEQREGWITALGQTQANLKLESLSWRLSPRTSSPLAQGLQVSNMGISASMVDVPGLHALLRQFHEAAPGRFTVENCSLAFNLNGISGQAECRLNWWTWENAPARP